MRIFLSANWTVDAADRSRLNAFEMDMYRRMLRISWTEHRTNNSILEELEPARRFLAEVKRRKLQYFGHMVRVDNLCTHVLRGIVVGKRRRGRPRRRWTDDMAMDRHTRCSVFSTQRTEARGEPWCPCQWPPILSHEDGPMQGNWLINSPRISYSTGKTFSKC